MTVEAPMRGLWRWVGLFSWGLTVASAALIGVAVVGSVLGGLDLSGAVSGFVVTNVAMALSFSLCGLILAVRRPSNSIGWLFLASGFAHAVTAAAVPMVMAGTAAAWPLWVVRTIATAGLYSWPWSISLFLPLALLLFPDGRPPSRRWRWLIWTAIAAAPLFVLGQGVVPTSLVPGSPLGYLTISDFDRLAPVWMAGELCQLLLLCAGVSALVLRYRRGSEPERRQLLWLLLATLVTLGVLIPWGLLDTGPVLMLLALPLVGGAVTIAILRHQLLDIRLVVSRAVLYLLLTVGVVLTYVVLVTLLELMLRRQVGLGVSILVTVLIAVGFNSIRVRLQLLFDRVMYAGMTPSDSAIRSPVRFTLLRYGLSSEVVDEAERLNVRYQIRALAILLIFGVVLNSALAGGLLRLGFAHLDDEQVWLLVVYAAISSVLTVLFTSALLQSLIRRNIVTHTVHLLLQVVARLSRLQELRRLNGQLRHRRRVSRILLTTRRELRSNSWQLAGNLAVLSGHAMSERDWPPTALLGRWLCWVCEDPNDADRVDGALQACADAVQHIMNSSSLGRPPPLRHPPRKAQMLNPTRKERWSRYGSGARTALISSIPLVTASIGLVTKLVL
ncbi:hypothetical protein [Actinocrispum sp. NPDC049592]|uniref:hypothetical protein n=1 Tax=Actinocrispum sp. NPDC049592 TaxID=3154835 RepID=UPI00342B3E92